MIDKVREAVKKEANENDWKYHVSVVVKYSKLLAAKLGADVELAELGALLHDIGRHKFGGENHQVTGIPEAQRIMEGLGYPQEAIDEVKHCVESHRGKKGSVTPRTKVAEIIANADAMAHFDILPMFFYWRAEKSTFDEALVWMGKKYERDWDKMTIPEAREMMKEKHETIKKVLEWNRQYM
ncbi:TPA: HD domain-containing protein [Candidatus Woesearchaeota archaeon]|nr:HD domain-containing protein [Candidatus Woesearchaeota archaeon]